MLPFDAVASTIGGLDHRTAVPDFSLEWTDGLRDWAMQSVITDGAGNWRAQPIMPDKPFSFPVVAPSARVERVRARLATYARRNTADLWCELHDPKGAVARSRFIPAGTVVDNAMTELLDLRGVELLPGAVYIVSLASPSAHESDRFAVWARDALTSQFDYVRRFVGFNLRRIFAYADRERSGELPRGETRAVLVTPRTEGQLAALARSIAAVLPRSRFDVVRPMPAAELWPQLAEADLVAFDGPLPGDDLAPAGFDALCFALHRRGCATAWLEPLGAVAVDSVRLSPGPADLAALQRERTRMRRCRLVLHPDGRLQDVEGDGSDLVPAISSSDAPLAALLAKVRDGRLPRVAVVSVLYRKAAVVAEFIRRVVRQSFPGQIDIVLVDDRSPEDDVESARQAGRLLAAAGVPNRCLHLVRNHENLGNCASRLRGIAALDADIYVVIDCDCLPNRDFVAAHVFEHARKGVDAVIGPLNIETNGRDPDALIRELDAHPSRVLQEAELQDSVQPDGFLNCITRNFSVKRDAARREPLFDTDFSYTAKPGTGFGWEDVEMGYRLYARGSTIRHTGLAFSVHVSHEASASDRVKVLGSMRNFERLFVKHPDLGLAGRRWALDTYDKIAGWAAASGAADTPEARALERRFAPDRAWAAPLVRSYRPGARRLRILTYRWHVPHQYELYKLPHDFTLVTHVGGNRDMDTWSLGQRPRRPNVRFRRAEEIRPQEFDVAILHFDENVLAPQLTNGVLPSSWGDQFRWLLAQADLPKVAICHGTPQFVGQYAANPARIAQFELHEHTRAQLVAVLAAHGVHVVCNSHQAAEEWRFANSRVIWHGFDPQEFPEGRHDLDILALAPDRHRPHYRGAAEHEIVCGRLDPRLRIGTAAHDGAASEPRSTHAYAVRNFRSYVDRIGRFRAYLNTTLRSPMPRSRGEAMMTGAFPVALRNHDVDRFIEPGVNGFYADEPEALAEFLNWALLRPEEAGRLCQAARRTALDVFNHDRYLAAWTQLLSEVAS